MLSTHRPWTCINKKDSSRWGYWILCSQKYYFWIKKMNNFCGDLSDTSATTATLNYAHAKLQDSRKCFYFSRYIVQFTPKIIYFESTIVFVGADDPGHMSFGFENKITDSQAWWTVLPFRPNDRLAHPENYLFLLSRKIFSWSKYPINILFNFEKGSTGDELWFVILDAVHFLHVLVRFPIALFQNFSTPATSVAVLAEIVLRSPRKLFIFIINQHIYRIKVSEIK